MVQKPCRDDPTGCLGRCIKDGLIFVSIFAFVTYSIQDKVVQMDKVITFLSLWIPALFLLRGLHMDILGDQLLRAGGWTMAVKMAGVLD